MRRQQQQGAGAPQLERPSYAAIGEQQSSRHLNVPGWSYPLLDHHNTVSNLHNPTLTPVVEEQHTLYNRSTNSTFQQQSLLDTVPPNGEDRTRSTLPAELRELGQGNPHPINPPDRNILQAGNSIAAPQANSTRLNGNVMDVHPSQQPMHYNPIGISANDTSSQSSAERPRTHANTRLEPTQSISTANSPVAQTNNSMQNTGPVEGHTQHSRSHYDYGQPLHPQQIAASVDDRNVLVELVNRTPPCESDHFQHVFVFILAIIPLFQLHLTSDCILMKYLLPKMRGQLSRIFLSMSAVQATFPEVCQQVRQEMFCNRACQQLAQTYFFQNFQTSNQSISEYFDNMNAAYVFLQIQLSEREAIEIMMENLLPEVLQSLAGHPWPSNFNDIPNLVTFLNRQTVTRDQRLVHSSRVRRPTVDTDTGLPQMENAVPGPVQRTKPNWQPGYNIKKCYNCGDPSHLKPQCPLLVPRMRSYIPNAINRQGPSSNAARIQCYSCQQFGHMQRHCPQRNNLNPGNVTHTGQ